MTASAKLKIAVVISALILSAATIGVIYTIVAAALIVGYTQSRRHHQEAD